VVKGLAWIRAHSFEWYYYRGKSKGGVLVVKGVCCGVSWVFVARAHGWGLCSVGVVREWGGVRGPKEGLWMFESF